MADLADKERSPRALQPGLDTSGPWVLSCWVSMAVIPTQSGCLRVTVAEAHRRSTDGHPRKGKETSGAKDRKEQVPIARGRNRPKEERYLARDSTARPIVFQSPPSGSRGRQAMLKENRKILS